MTYFVSKSDIWNADQLAQARKDFEKPRSVREFFSWLTHPDTNYDLVREASAVFPLNYKNIPDHPVNLEKFTVANIAKIVSVDLEPASKKILQASAHITSETTEVSKLKKVSQEYNFQKSSGFTKQTHIIDVVPDYPELARVGELFGFDYYSTAIQYQPPGSIVGRHVDFLDSMWDKFNQSCQDVLDLPYDTLTKSPEGYYAIRVMIALTDWQVGQIFGFENQYWSEWKIGDVVTFDWAHVKHYTANSSYVPRIYLKISGITKNKNHWIFKNLNHNVISTI
jgi:hypothetical protein